MLQKQKNLEVQLDKGVPDGHRYTFKGESDEIPDVEAGDVIVEILVDKHKKFTRKGADLIYHADITLIEALGGFELVIEHLDKRKIHVKTKAGEMIKPGELRTVKECGMPFFNSPYRFGNMYVQFNIVFPEKVTEEQKTQLSKVIKDKDILSNQIMLDIPTYNFSIIFKCVLNELFDSVLGKYLNFYSSSG